VRNPPAAVRHTRFGTTNVCANTRSAVLRLCKRERIIVGGFAPAACAIPTVPGGWRAVSGADCDSHLEWFRGNTSAPCPLCQAQPR